MGSRRRGLLAAACVAVPLLAGRSAHPQQEGPQARAAQIATMLDALRAAPDARAAAVLEQRIQEAWLANASPSVRLLLGRGLRDLRSGAADAAVGVFSDAIVLSPDLSEAYHQRAIARFRSGDAIGAVRDLNEAMNKDPRNFAALRTLTDIAVSLEDWKTAYEAWQKMLDIDPHAPDGADRLRDLRRRALGEEL